MLAMICDKTYVMKLNTKYSIWVDITVIVDIYLEAINGSISNSARQQQLQDINLNARYK